MDQKARITIETTVNAPVDKVWKFWSEPEHITKWNSGSEDWHTPHAENDLRTGGKFSARMEAKDGTQGFDFGGVYDKVETNKLIEYTIEDGRKVKITFVPDGLKTHITETFEAENDHPMEMQKAGWQNILNIFKKHAETS